MRIDGLRAPRKRPPPDWSDLPPDARSRAWRRFKELVARARRLGPVPPWHIGILAAQARRLGKQSAAELSSWGRSMLAKRGGYAVQDSYVLERRMRPHPARKAWLKSAAVRKRRGSKNAKGASPSEAQAVTVQYKNWNAHATRIGGLPLTLGIGWAGPGPHPLDVPEPSAGRRGPTDVPPERRKR
jgi:hypothetical protein